jgi:hypothetical protein
MQADRKHRRRRKAVCHFLPELAKLIPAILPLGPELRRPRNGDDPPGRLHDSQSDVIWVPLFAYPTFALRVVFGYWQDEAVIEKNIRSQRRSITMRPNRKRCPTLTSFNPGIHVTHQLFDIFWILLSSI